MKKLILAIGLLFLFTACKSGWSCKKRYCEAQSNTQTELLAQANV